MSGTIIVGMADMKTGRGGDILTTLGLGSCVGITLFDQLSGIGGMVHVMLPDSKAFRAETAMPAKFADTGIALLRDSILRMGARQGNLVAKIAGGANMFTQTSGSDVLRIGARNAQSARDVLRGLSIGIVSDDTGGTYGRTISLSTADGRLLVKTIGHGERYI